MISVTMDLMDMSELPVCPVPDLASLSSTPQDPPVTTLTDISTFSAQPQPTGEYNVTQSYQETFVIRVFVKYLFTDEGCVTQ